MKKPPTDADVAYAQVREIALRFAGAEEKLSHGAPSFHVRGKLFLQFVDHHHSDGRIAVWCKSTLEEQRRRVAAEPARYFVPPYVGVRGWVGVNVDAANADWIELAILVEAAWSSVAPPRLLREPGAVRSASPRPAPTRVTTDAKVAARALERVSSLVSALDEAQTGAEIAVERSNQHATFRAGKRVFAYFLDNHHGDGVVALCVKTSPRECKRLVASEPERFYSPAYIGPRGYLGIRLNVPNVDWRDVEARFRKSYLGLAGGVSGGSGRAKLGKRRTLRD